jgi:hypothetical protein
MWKKPIVVLFIAVLIPMGFGNVSTAAIKSGSTCNVLGKKVVIGSKIYTCVKSGKKLLWNKSFSPPVKATSTLKPSPSPKPSVEPTPTNSPTSVPTPKPSATLPIPEIITISQLPLNFKFIKYWAWTKTWEEIKSNPENITPIEVLVGPNSKACHREVTLKAIRLLQKVYADSKLPKKLWLLYADMDVDRAWMESKTLTLLPSNRIQYNKNKQMDAIETVNPNGEGVVWAQNSCNARSAENFSSEVLHGYTHTIQDLQYSEFPNSYGRWGEVPRWLIEGAASWSQVFYNDNEDLKKFEKSGDWGQLQPYDQKFYNDYLVIPTYNNNIWEYTDKWPSMRAYDLGSYICDMLIALRGPASIIELNKDYLSTGSFEKSFENIYGMTWAKAQPYFSEAAFSLIKWLNT